MEKFEDSNDVADKLQKYIEQLNDTLLNDIPKEIKEISKYYNDLLALSEKLNGKLSK